MRWGLVLLVAALGACRGAAPRAPNPVPPVREFLVREANVPQHPITVRLEIPLAPAGRKPAVIALLGENDALRAAGAIVVSFIDWSAKPPPPPAENTAGKWVLASPSAAVLGREYLRSIARTANEVIPRVVDYLVTLPEIDPGRTGMTGSSTNGFITLQAVAADGRLSAAVAVAACGDHLRFLRFSSMGMAGQPLQLDPEYERWLHGQEPIRHSERLVHAALLVVNRVDDPLIPISCAESTAHVLERAYARAGVPERFRFVRTQESGHGVGKAEGEEALAWLRRWLLEPRR